MALPLGTTEVVSGEDAVDFGFSVAIVPDVDGDQRPDILVGAPQMYDVGAVVLLSSGSEWEATPAHMGGYADPAGGFGSAVTSGGTMLGAATTAVIVGAPNDNGGDGALFVYEYDGNWEAGNFARVVPDGALEKGMGIGLRLAATDMDGDGQTDVLAGGNESVLLVYGGDSFGAVADELSGKRVSGAGDVNGDGYWDAVTSDEGHGSPNERTGAVWLHLGGASPATDAQFIEGELHQWLGSWVAGGTDLHGDGYADVAVGALGAPPMIIPGGPEGADVDGLLTVGSGSATTDWPGGVHAPDVNGDGLDELVLSTHEQASGADHLLFVLGGVDREVAEQPAGSGPCNGYGCLGFSMDAADLDGDGLGDVVAGHVDNSSVRIQYSRCVDADLDGYCDDEDCDDTNPDIHPEAVDWCDDFIDSDCDGVGEVDEHPLCDTNACAGCSSSSVRWSILAVLAVALRRRRYSGAQ